MSLMNHNNLPVASDVHYNNLLTSNNEEEEKEQQCGETKKVVQVQCELNGIPLSTEQPESIFGDISIHDSQSVHIGNKTIYKGPVTINQTVYNNSINNTNNDSKEKLENDEKTLFEEKQIKLSKLFQSRRYVIVIGLFVAIVSIAILAIIFIILFNNSSVYAEVPSPPLGPVNIVQISNDTVSINWREPESNRGASIEGYKITVKDVIDTEWIEVGYVDYKICSMIVKNLTEYHDYNVRIYAKNKIGFSKPLESQSFEIQLPNDTLKIVTRQDWQASRPKIPPITLQIIPAPYVIICHTVYWYCMSIGSCSTSLQKLQRSAIDSGYGDIEYNFAIGFGSNIYEARGWDVTGNHTNDYDHRSIAIGFIGNYTTFYPTNNQIAIIKKFLNYGVGKKKIAKNYKLLGQKQVKDSDSPGKYLYEEIQKWEHWSLDP